MTEMFRNTHELLRRSTAQVIFVTFILLAVYFAYGAVIYLCGCFFIPDFIGSDFKDINLPDSYSPAIICIIAAGIIIGYMLVTPLSFGADWCFFHAAKGRQIPLECLFTCIMDKYRRRKVWLINVVSTGSKLVILSACAALIRAFQMAYRQAEESGISEGMFVFIKAGTAVLLAFFIITYFLLTVRYFMIPYVFAENPDGDVRMLITKAVGISEGSRRKIALLAAVYLPVYILCIPGFPFLAAIPAVRAMNAVCAVKFIDDADARAADEDENEEYRK